MKKNKEDQKTRHGYTIKSNENLEKGTIKNIYGKICILSRKYKNKKGGHYTYVYIEL